LLFLLGLNPPGNPPTGGGVLYYSNNKVGIGTNSPSYFLTVSSTLKSGNVGIGTTNPGTNRLEVVGGPIKATGGLIIETRTSDPASPLTGQIWLRTDL
jgi:hypothetical protein